MANLISNSASFLGLVYALTAPAVLLAGEWVVREDPMGPGYIVTDDETGTIHTKGRKAADKVAKVLNDTESGVVDTGEGPCGDPSSGVLC